MDSVSFPFQQHQQQMNQQNMQQMQQQLSQTQFNQMQVQNQAGPPPQFFGQQGMPQQSEFTLRISLENVGFFNKTLNINHLQ